MFGHVKNCDCGEIFGGALIFFLGGGALTFWAHDFWYVGFRLWEFCWHEKFLDM